MRTLFLDVDNTLLFSRKENPIFRPYLEYFFAQLHHRFDKILFLTGVPQDEVEHLFGHAGFLDFFAGYHHWTSRKTEFMNHLSDRDHFIWIDDLFMPTELDDAARYGNGKYLTSLIKCHPFVGDPHDTELRDLVPLVKALMDRWPSVNPNYGLNGVDTNSISNVNESLDESLLGDHDRLKDHTAREYTDPPATHWSHYLDGLDKLVRSTSDRIRNHCESGACPHGKLQRARIGTAADLLGLARFPHSPSQGHGAADTALSRLHSAIDHLDVYHPEHESRRIRESSSRNEHAKRPAAESLDEIVHPAHLYHGAPIHKGIEAYASGHLLPGTKNKHGKGFVAFTRNPDVAKLHHRPSKQVGGSYSYPGITFIFNRDSVRNNHRLIPHNQFSTPRVRKSRPAAYHDESEERVPGSIPNFRQHLHAIVASHEHIASYENLLKNQLDRLSTDKDVPKAFRASKSLIAKTRREFDAVQKLKTDPLFKPDYFHPDVVKARHRSESLDEVVHPAYLYHGTSAELGLKAYHANTLKTGKLGTVSLTRDPRYAHSRGAIPGTVKRRPMTLVMDRESIQQHHHLTPFDYSGQFSGSSVPKMLRKPTEYQGRAPYEAEEDLDHDLPNLHHHIRAIVVSRQHLNQVEKLSRRAIIQHHLGKTKAPIEGHKRRLRAINKLRNDPRWQPDYFSKEVIRKRHRTESIDESSDEYAAVLCNLPPKVIHYVKAMQSKIDQKDLSGDGYEDHPHITLRWGLHDIDPNRVDKILREVGPIKVTLGSTSVFPPSTGSEHNDVVKIAVQSSDLQRLHHRLAQLPHTDTHLSYLPHVTLAYVRPGMGRKYAGMDDLSGYHFMVDSLRFSDPDRNYTSIKLA